MLQFKSSDNHRALVEADYVIRYSTDDYSDKAACQIIADRAMT